MASISDRAIVKLNNNSLAAAFVSGESNGEVTELTIFVSGSISLSPASEEDTLIPFDGSATTTGNLTAGKWMFRPGGA